MGKTAIWSNAKRKGKLFVVEGLTYIHNASNENCWELDEILPTTLSISRARRWKEKKEKARCVWVGDMRGCGRERERECGAGCLKYTAPPCVHCTLMVIIPPKSTHREGKRERSNTTVFSSLFFSYILLVIVVSYRDFSFSFAFPNFFAISFRRSERMWVNFHGYMYSNSQNQSLRVWTDVHVWALLRRLRRLGEVWEG